MSDEKKHWEVADQEMAQGVSWSESSWSKLVTFVREKGDPDGKWMVIDLSIVDPETRQAAEDALTAAGFPTDGFPAWAQEGVLMADDEGTVRLDLSDAVRRHRQLEAQRKIFGRHLCFDRQGKPMTTGKWARLMEEKNEHWERVFRVEETSLPDGKLVSTVWTGLNHQYGDGPPLIFETMVFTQKDQPRTDIDSLRYSTEEEARAGHAEMVRPFTAELACECGAAKSQGIANGQAGHADYCPAR
jgi:hypothetical protein